MLGQLKVGLFIFFIMQIVYAPLVFAERDFKCYVELPNKKATIKNQFANSPKQAKSRLLKRLSKKTGHGQRDSVIKECVKVQAEFSTYKAHKLDLITPQ